MTTFSGLVLPTPWKPWRTSLTSIVVVTMAGVPVESLPPGLLPNNVRVAQYLPFEWVLRRSDAFRHQMAAMAASIRP